MEDLFSVIYVIVVLACIMVTIVANWRIFEKAGVEGWKVLIPFYNGYCLYQIVYGKGLLFLLTLIPCIGVLFALFTGVQLARAFGKSLGWGILFMVFIPVVGNLLLAFGSCEYEGNISI